MLESKPVARPISLHPNSNTAAIRGCEWCGSLVQPDHFLHHSYICPKCPSILKLDALLNCQVNYHEQPIDRYMYKQLHLKENEFLPFLEYVESYFLNYQVYYTCKYCQNNYGCSILMEHVFTCSKIANPLKFHLISVILNQMKLSDKRIDLAHLNKNVYQMPLEKFRQEKMEATRLEVSRQLQVVRDNKRKIDVNPTTTLPPMPIKRNDSVISVESVKLAPKTPQVPKVAKTPFASPTKLSIYTDIKVKELEASRMRYVISILEAVSKTEPTDQKRLLEIALTLNNK